MKFYPKNLNLISLLFFCGLLFADGAEAQFSLPSLRLPSTNLTPVLSLESEQGTSLANSVINVFASISGTTNAKNSTYDWFLNGIKQSAASGLNKNAFSFRAGALGTVYRVNVSVIMPDGKNLSDTITFTASDINLSWNASNEAPAFYRGKVLPTRHSAVSVSALPFIYRPGTKTLIGPGSLIFNWFINDKLDTGNSGLGKSDFNFRVGSFPGSDAVIRLEAKTQDNKIDLNKFITIPVVRPQTLIYLADDKNGLPYGKAIKDLAVKSATVKSLNFTAENYFFNSSKDNLKWNWMVNNKEVSGGGNKPWTAILNVPSNIFPGSFQIRTTAKNAQYNLESSGSTANLEIK